MDILTYGLIYGYINIEYEYINIYLEWLCIQSYNSSNTHRDVNIHALLNGFEHIPVTHTKRCEYTCIGYRHIPVTHT